jgi:spore germination protein KA
VCILKKWFDRKIKGNQKSSSDEETVSFQGLIKKCRESKDFITFQQGDNFPFIISYFKTLVNPDFVHREVLDPISKYPINTLVELKNLLPVESIVITKDVKQIQDKLLTGFILIQEKKDPSMCALVPAVAIEKRQISIPETEFSVVGPKEAFVENLDINLNMVRKRIPIPDLHIKEIIVGKLSKTRVSVMYIHGIANEENIKTVIQRIRDIEFDQLIDASFITQMMTDNQHSPFPQLIDTERPDRVASVLSEGKIAIFVDGSPQVLTGPTTLPEFFSAFEDYFLTWHLASAFRIIRLGAVMFSVLSTPLYVAILTYHYEMIPKDLLSPLIASRSGIPFPPILEAIILEVTIELLREAGARLPTKVGQTIGIVGGIVIGTAAVEAGLTSNVLLIIVALAALASFTTPVYQMSNSIRLIRFPFILSAQLLGMLGVMVCLGFFFSHLLKLTSLGRPYIAPIYPLRIMDLKDSLFRLPLDRQGKRPMQLRTGNPNRFNSKRAELKRKAKIDIED